MLPGQAPMPSAAIRPFPCAVAMQQQIPEVTGITHLTGQRLTVMIGDRQFSGSVRCGRPEFLPAHQAAAGGRQSRHRVLPGRIRWCCRKPRARKYFGDAEPLGKTIILSENRCDDQGANCQVNQYALKVTGVMRDLPHNSHLLLDALFPITSNADPMSQTERSSLVQHPWLGLCAACAGRRSRCGGGQAEAHHRPLGGSQALVGAPYAAAARSCRST